MAALDLPPRIDIGALREASSSFSRSTAATFDGFHVRHFRLLCDDALLCLAIILQVMEAIGMPPPQLATLSYVLLPKPRGGFRPICIFPGAIRIWSKCRRPFLSPWVAANDRVYFNCGTGRRAVDPVWRNAARTEAKLAADPKSAAGTVLWDAAKFFERFCLRRLYERGKRLGIDLWLLRMAINLYRGPRYFSMDGASTGPFLFSDSGLPAGCRFANIFVRVYTMEGLDGFVSMCPELTLDTFIDDLAFSAEGTESFVAGALVRGASHLKRIVQSGFRCSIAQSKAAVVSSSDIVVKKVRAALGEDAGPFCQHAAFLGVDYTAGRRRRHGAATTRRAMRFKEAKRRHRVLSRFTSFGPRLNMLYRGGVLPAAEFGCEVNGVSNAELLQLQQWSVARLPPHCRGTSLTAKLLLHGDKTARAATAPLAQWQRAVWQAAVAPASAMVHPRTLSQWWGAAAPQAATTWASSRGPINAAILSAKRLGWSMLSAFEVTDDGGHRFFLADVSPAGFNQLLAAAAQRVHEMHAAKKLAASYGGSGPQRVSFDVPRRLYRSRKTSGPSRAAIATLACDGFWPKTRLAEAGYILDDTLCDLCRAATDTMHHRIYECPGASFLRDTLVDPLELEELLTDAHAHPWQTRAVRPHPGAAAPPPRAAGVEFIAYTDAGHTFGGDIFIDGSCMPGQPGLARAGFAAIEVDASGRTLGAVYGTVPPHLPQTSGAAEHAALAAAAPFLTRPATFHADCLAVVRSAFSPPASWAKLVHGGMIKHLHNGHAFDKVRDVVKVKAHQRPGAEAAPVERWRAAANNAVDEAAKEAVRLHPAPSEALARLSCAQERLAVVTATLAARLCVLWQRAETRGRTQRRRRAPAATDAIFAQHEWAFWTGAARCWTCWRTFSADRMHEAPSTCSGPPAFLRQIASDAKGHCIVRFEPESPIARPLFACVRCGCYVQKSLPVNSLFHQRCIGVARKHGARSIVRLLEGRHPDCHRADLRGASFVASTHLRVFREAAHEAGWC